MQEQIALEANLKGVESKLTLGLMVEFDFYVEYCVFVCMSALALALCGSSDLSLSCFES